EGDPEYLGVGQGGAGVGGERQVAARQAGRNQVVEAGLVQGRLTPAQVVDELAVEVEADDVVSCFRQAGRRHAAEVPQPEHGHAHALLLVPTRSVGTSLATLRVAGRTPGRGSILLPAALPRRGASRGAFPRGAWERGITRRSCAAPAPSGSIAD